MSFTPGDRVRWATKDFEGTVLDDHSKDYPTFIAVQWDDGSRTFSAPNHMKTVKNGPSATSHSIAQTANETNN